MSLDTSDRTPDLSSFDWLYDTYGRRSARRLINSIARWQAATTFEEQAASLKDAFGSVLEVDRYSDDELAESDRLAVLGWMRLHYPQMATTLAGYIMGGVGMDDYVVHALVQLTGERHQ